MISRCARGAIRLACILCCLTLPAALLWAQNENESVGFQSNHPFESGQFGEDIDILNGNLHLSIPIGPAYQLNQHFGYQLVATYNSKVWDLSRWDGGTKLEQRGSLGLGFNLNFGRIYRDVEFDNSNPNINPHAVRCSWLYVSPDGNEHVLPVEASPPSVGNACQSTFQGKTIDNSFIQVSGGDAITSTWGGNPTNAPTLTVTTPDGTTYTFGHFVQVYMGSLGVNSIIYTTLGDETGDISNYNRDFGGWYVTRITNARADATKSWVDIEYDDTPGYNHLIHRVVDHVNGSSTNRIITFNNGCEPAATTSGCVEAAVGSNNEANRASTRINSIELPAFSGSTDVNNAVTATYGFTYVSKLIPNPLTGTRVERANLLTRIDYPSFDTNAGSQIGYSMHLAYGDLDATPPLHYGEIESRTLPTEAVIGYEWGLYEYAPVIVGSYNSLASAGSTQQLVRKTVSLPGETNVGSWFYTRETGQFGTRYTNPLYTIVKDPAGNETVYYYRASAPNLSTAPTQQPRDTDDGFAPEWNDGANYKTEYYQGNGSARRLVRSVLSEYDADLWMGSKRDKSNIRANRVVTIFNDDGGARSTVAYSNWDGKGHYKMVSETGDDVAGTRTTYTAYTSEDPNVFSFREVRDGPRILSRTDYEYTTAYSGRLPIKMIERFTLPGVVGTPVSLSAAVNDITTCYQYDSLYNVSIKAITDHASCSTDPEVADSRRALVLYTWQGGGYLATKKFYDGKRIPPLLPRYFKWKAIDRSRDGNTGLIFAVRDTAGIETEYDYDELGRLRTITPPGAEFPTEIEYVDVTHTTVRQSDPAISLSDYSCGFLQGNYIMACYEYDALGRLSKTEKRSYAPELKNSYQKKFYDILGRVTFESEWLWRPNTDPPTPYCANPDSTPAPPNPCVGTRYDYRDASDPTQTDPFGRVRKVTMADDAPLDPKKILTEYFGLSTSVTVQKVRGASGANFDATTTYRRDGWGRLIGVEVPTGPSSPSGGADATYVYDLRDNLVLVDLIDKTSLEHQTRTFEYDSLNRIRSSNNPESGPEVITSYDSLGNVTEKIDASGNRMIFTYDGAGRLTRLDRKEYQKPGFLEPPSVTVLENTYDMDGTVDCAEPPNEQPPSGSLFKHCSGRLTKKDSRDEQGNSIRYQEFYYAGLNGRLSTERNIYAGWPSGQVAPIVTDYNNFGLESQTTYPEGPAGKWSAPHFD